MNYLLWELAQATIRTEYFYGDNFGHGHGFGYEHSDGSEYEYWTECQISWGNGDIFFRL